MSQTYHIEINSKSLCDSIFHPSVIVYSHINFQSWFFKLSDQICPNCFKIFNRSIRNKSLHLIDFISSKSILLCGISCNSLSIYITIQAYLCSNYSKDFHICKTCLKVIKNAV